MARQVFGDMRQMACVDLPAMPLQLASRRHPAWRKHALVVIDRDHSRGIVQWVNHQARRKGILSGMRYAECLSIDSDLRAAVVATNDIAEAREEILVVLRRFSPRVEPAPIDDNPGIFWLDADGLMLLYPSLYAWAVALRAALFEQQFFAAVAVGFSRFSSYATVCTLRGHARSRAQVIWASAAEEQLATMQVPLAQIDLDSKSRDALAQLGVHTIGQLVTLPEAGLVRRFGKAAQHLHQLASGARIEPMTPEIPVETFCSHIDFDDPVVDRDALLFFSKQLLDPLLGRVAGRGEAVRELVLTLHIDTGVVGSQGATSMARPECLRPAVPSLDGPLLLQLVRLRLEHGEHRAGVRSLSLDLLTQRATREQLALFSLTDPGKRPTRNLALGTRALARLRAALGDGAVVKARLRLAHLPEARYTWEPLDIVVTAAPRLLLRGSRRSPDSSATTASGTASGATG